MWARLELPKRARAEKKRCGAAERRVWKVGSSANLQTFLILFVFFKRFFFFFFFFFRFGKFREGFLLLWFLRFWFLHFSVHLAGKIPMPVD